MLSPQALSHLTKRLKRHEGMELRPYRCTSGKLTIGVGRNLEDRGITVKEALLLLDTDINMCMADARSFHCWTKLNEPRKTVLVEMCFQMGKSGVLKFKRFLIACGKESWDEAADEMLDSKWAKQTPTRAETLAGIIRRGTYDW